MKRIYEAVQKELELQQLLNNVVQQKENELQQLQKVARPRIQHPRRWQHGNYYA